MNDEPRLLAGRYEVGDLIGRGGMAEVHIGYDTRLGRSVAIKILRADLARDPSFQTRFRREAQAAAGLNHPSIVAVYDTGEDQLRNDHGVLQAVPFIVMEYVEGHTVRDILKGDVAAPIDEAVEITLGVLSGLDYAHHAGLVHRDIKPANVMLTPTGAVKVMDFGIARALADIGQTMTQTQAVVGTAQYLSPEQARGENVDARSDLYSTGCLLFELLTGRPPFIGDSPVSVAYQHVREQAPKPSQFASDVPASLDAVVERALQKDRNMRYSSAQEFSADLQRAMGGAVAPITGAQPVGSAAMGSAAWGAGAAGVAAAAAAAPAAANPYAPGAPAPTAPLPTPAASTPATGATAVMPGGFGGNAGWGAVMDTPPTPPMAPRPVRGTLVTDDDLVEDDPRRRRMIQIGIAAAAVVALIVLVSVLFALAGKGGGGGDDNPAADTVVIPILAGTLQADAESRLEKLGLVTETSEESSDDVEEGRVIRSEPDAGEEVDKGFSVMLVISTGPDISEVPDVRGQLQVDAVAALEDAGLKVSKVEVDHDPVIEADRATKTDPAAGQELKKGDEVILYVSDGQVQLTDLRNKKSTDAQAELVQLGLVASTQEVETGDFPPGTVIEQSPIPGLVPQGSTVTIKVAKAITTVGVPDVVGKTQANATGLLQGAGFTVTVLNAESPTVPAGKVISQNPAANSQATAGTAVTITVSTGPPDPTPTPAP